MLHKKHLSIDEIAWESGFTDASHLAKVFRSVYYITPAEYRKAL